MRGLGVRKLGAGRLVLLGWFLLTLATPVEAYIGPGAGFALVSSFFVVLTTILATPLLLLYSPLHAVWRWIRRPPRGKALIRRLIVVGLDGQSPDLTDRFMREGKLPHFKKLAEQGCYRALATTFPAVSPVAWSSFSTGTHPAKHNIFDFLDRDPRTYLPRLSSTRIGKRTRFLKLGRYRIPLAKPELRLLRKSRPFWSILGAYDIWSTILRVPITFPPDRFYGAQLSAMCVPDLLGTQGTFLLHTTRSTQGDFEEGGLRIPLEANGSRFVTTLPGPENVFVDGNPTLEIPLRIDLDRAAGRAHLDLDGISLTLEPGQLSNWITLTYRAAPGLNVSGLCRMMVIEMDEHFSLYTTPLSLDPEKPAMPVSHPHYFATYLAKKIGSYSTLGLAEDTWALNEGVIDEETFLKQTYDIDREREQMFFAALDRTRRGALVCVFDATDRIQHMFWRYLDEGHPAAQNQETSQHRKAVENLYTHNDRMLGRIMDRVRADDMLMVISDHGFASFRRGVNLNSWLHAHGYLHLRKNADPSGEWLAGVDWSRTRAYALGLTGMYLNIEGREANGIVKPEEVTGLRRELIARLRGLEDEERGEIGIRDVFDTRTLYQGPYLDNAPDLLIGYNAGYRTSWACAKGVVAGPVFEDNLKAWSGDHCVDPRLVPGVFFSNHEIDREGPALIDIAPTALELFGIDPPPHMDGKTLVNRESFAEREKSPRS